jgi:hypothetical protein
MEEERALVAQPADRPAVIQTETPPPAPVPTPHPAPAPAPEPATPAPAPPALRRRARRLGVEGALWAGLTLLALLLRLDCLDCTSLWRDEIAVLEGLQGGLAAVAASNVPLYSFQVWLTSQLADPASTGLWVRLPSALAGALTPLVIYALGRLWWGRAAGLLAALLTALAPVLLAYAQEMRAYTQLTLLTAAAVYSLARTARTDEGRWLLAAGALLGAAALMSRTVLVMVLPAMAPFAAWVAVRWWIRRGRHTRAGQLALGALVAAVLLGAVVLFWQRARVINYITPFALPDLSPAGLASLTYITTQQILFFTPFPFAEPISTLVRQGLVSLVLVGLAAGLLRRGARQGALVCALLVGVPLVVLTLGSAVNIIYPRFALVALPFAFLLAAHGLVAPLRGLLRRRRLPPALRGALVGAGGMLAAALVLPFALGAADYYTPAGNAALAYRPDYRAVTHYLTERAKPNDLILFVGWDDRVADFYWHGRPPAASYSALDPRLYRHRGPGAVYWVLSYDDTAPDRLVASRAWATEFRAERLIVLREDSPNIAMQDLMTDFTSRMFDNAPLDPVLARAALIMRAGVLQTRGFIIEAVQTYQGVGSDAPTRAFGREWLQVAEDSRAAGQPGQAWRAALMAEYHQPDAPAVHRWLAAQLAASGLSSESTWATAVAEALEKR